MRIPTTLELINKIQQNTRIKFIWNSEPKTWQWCLGNALMSKPYNTPEEAVIGCIKFFSSFFDEVDMLCKRLSAYTEENEND